MEDVLESSEPVRLSKRLGYRSGNVAEQIKALVSARAGNAKEFNILIAQIDPDALGAAFGAQEMLRILGHESVIYYCGKVGHPQNEALCNKFNLFSKMRLLDKSRGKNDLQPEQLTNVLLVDSNRARDSRIPIVVDPVIVIDHHKDSDVEQTAENVVWLDEDVGSASTMVAEILSAIAPEDWEFPQHIALMLALGVYTDTKSMIRAGERDQSAYTWCKRYANYTDLIGMILYKRPFSFLTNLSKAIDYVETNNTFKQGRIVASLGELPSKRGDDLAMIADEFLRTTGVVLAITWAVVEQNGNKNVRVCARSEDLTLNLSEFLRTRFGQKSGAKTLPDGAGEGGALVELEVGPWLREDELIEAVGRRIKEWLFDEPEEKE